MIEQERLATVGMFCPSDAASVPGLDRLTSLAASLFDAPISLVSLVDDDRQWIKSRWGLDVTSTPREHAFCAHVLPLGPDGVLVVEDAAVDPRFADNPLVLGPPGIRFYAGAALTASNGSVLGALCVIDTSPRPAPPSLLIERLRALAGAVVDQLELGRILKHDRERKRLLEMAEAMSGVGHWRLDLASKRVAWSREVYIIHGVTPETFDPNLDEAIGFYVAEDQPKVEAFLSQVAASTMEQGFDLRLRRSDGEVRIVASRAHCERDSAGTPVAIFGVFQDITEHQRALDLVRSSTKLYRLLTDHSTDLIARSNLDSDILYLSPAIETLTGYRPEELLGRKTYDLLHPDDWPLARREYAKLVQFGSDARISPITYRLRRKDSSYVWVEVSPKLVWVDDGMPEFVDVVRDITVRRAAEDALVEARKAAESAAEVKAQFLANMSHELRTPLTSIIGFNRLLGEQTNLPSLAMHCIEKVDVASHALLCAVNDILDFSRLEAGQVAITPKPTDVRSFCRTTMDLMDPIAGAKNLVLQREIEDATPDGLTFDPDRLRQVLLNFLGNAVKFTDAGTIGLHVSFDTRRNEMTASVTDTGPGIEPTKLGLLFKRFSQLDEGLARAHGGAGLGLAICKGLVEAMGGSVGVASTPGVGSRFWCTLPAQPVDLPQPMECSEIASGDVIGLRVLVVDDNPMNHELSRAILTAAGCEITEALDGRTALRLAAERPFDAILMDLFMPGLDGVQTLRELRGAEGPNDATPVLAFTANADGRIADLMAAGFDGVVAKPIHPGRLLRSLFGITHVQEYRDAS